MQTEPETTSTSTAQDQFPPAAQPTPTAELPELVPATVDTLHSAFQTLNSPSSLQLSRPLQSSSMPLNPQPSTLNLPPPPTIIDTKPLPVPAAQQRKARRTGRIASLPKIQRDMVNRMISNGVPYKNIVGALDEADFTVTERNISNWATGGYLEWQLEQSLVLQNRLDQDHLLDHLRRNDATELPEVGLQAAATRLSQILVQKTARADDLEGNLGNVSQMVDLLSRLTRELSALQKLRDDSRRSLGRAHDPARIKDMDETSAIEHERSYSNPAPDSGLAKPETPPLLPPLPTSIFLADQDECEAMQREKEARLWAAALLRGSDDKRPAATRKPQPASLPPPESSPC